MMIRRVYSETLPYSELVRPRTLQLLARYGLEVVLAVRPWDRAALPDVARALRDAGVPLSIWPMLADEDGRWASVHNAPAFCRLTLSVCEVLEGARAPLRDVLFDLEPPFAKARSLATLSAGSNSGSGSSAHAEPAIAHAKAWPDGIVALASGLAPASSPAFAAASQVLATTVREIHDRGIDTSMAVWPLVALDRPDTVGWQSLLGTPVDGVGAGHVSVMMYTSILEGWSRGALRRGDATALLSAATARSMRRWGPGAGVSLGCVGTGAFEDEPVYRDPSELAEDVAVARAAGCEQLSLFDLGGVLAREPAEAWLEAFVAEGSGVGAERATSRRVRVARRLARAVSWVIGRPRS